jgi:hypothetical protein
VLVTKIQNNAETLVPWKWYPISVTLVPFEAAVTSVCKFVVVPPVLSLQVPVMLTVLNCGVRQKMGLVFACPNVITLNIMSDNVKKSFFIYLFINVLIIVE